MTNEDLQAIASLLQPIHTRLDNMDTRFDSMETRLDKIESEVSALKAGQRVQKIEHGMKKVKKLSAMEEWLLFTRHCREVFSCVFCMKNPKLSF